MNIYYVEFRLNALYRPCHIIAESLADVDAYCKKKDMDILNIKVIERDVVILKPSVINPNLPNLIKQ